MTSAPTNRRHRAALVLAGAGAAIGAGIALQARRTRVRVLADPAGEALAAPLDGRRIEVAGRDGTRLNVRAFGPEDAPTIVLGHGWTCALRFWTLQIQDLARDHRVIGWDLRGHGDSESPVNRDYTIETLADDLEAVLAGGLRDGERAVVAGHSLGGMALVAWAGRNPDAVGKRLAAAALLNTGVGGLMAESLVIRSPARLEYTRDLAMRALLSAAAPMPPIPNPITHEVVRYVALSRNASPAVVEFSERMVLECGPEARTGVGMTLTKLDLYEHVAQLTAPTTVVAGELDRLTPPIHSRRLEDALPDATYVELPGVGHMAPLESPAEINGILRDLVGTHLVRPSEVAA
jgi:pimeloyl-ACP methyl ester carboxylesterase